ncbi:MAG: hypothetical protein WBW80_15755 [Acidimicrobiales bacterium]
MRDGRRTAYRLAVGVGALALSSMLLATAPPAWGSTTTTKPKAAAKKPPPKKGPTVIFQQTGTGTSTTATFTAPNAGWNLKWNYNCAASAIPDGNGGTIPDSGTGDFFVEVAQAPGKGTMASLEDQPVNQGPGAGASGTEHYHYGGGGVYLKIDSECAWTVVATTA